jgi:hypothetical protein
MPCCCCPVLPCLCHFEYSAEWRRNHCMRCMMHVEPCRCNEHTHTHFWSYRNTQICSSGAQKCSKSFCRTLISTAYAAVTRACNRGPTLSDVNNTFCCHTTQTDGTPLMFTRMLCYAHMTPILSPGCCGMRCLNSRMPECLTALLHCDLVVEGGGA